MAMVETGGPDTSRMLAGQAFADDDLQACRRHAEAAFRGYRDRGDLPSAARMAMLLATLHGGSLGNRAAEQGWLERARRTLEKVGPCVEWGYLELALMACDRPDAIELERSAERALDIALEFGDHDLEVCALADGGLALITQGRVQEGFERLDAAMTALTAGEVHDPGIAGKSFCSLLSGCDRAGDIARAEEWTRIIGEMVTGPTGGRPVVLVTHCLLAYGSVLAAAGRWDEADTVMTTALGPTASKSLGHRIEITCNLARIRVEQGRVEEAAALLAPYEDQVVACEPSALVQLRKGDAALAAAIARRGLKELAGDALRGGPLLSRLVEAELMLGDVDAAASAADSLSELATAAESVAIAAQAGSVSGRELRWPAAITPRPSPSSRPCARAALDRSMAAADGHRPHRARRSARRAGRHRGARSGRPAPRRRSSSGWAPAPAPTVSRLCSVASEPRRRRGRETAKTGPWRRSAHGRPRCSASSQAGHTNAEIAKRLYISPKTAEHHVSRVLSKLGVRTRAEAAALAAARPAYPLTPYRG